MSDAIIVDFDNKQSDE